MFNVSRVGFGVDKGSILCVGFYDGWEDGSCKS